MTAPLMSQAEFGRHIGADRSYVTQLKNAGRLVMQDGKVNAEASLQLIADTTSPDKAGVAARHQQEKQQKQDNNGLDDITGRAGSAYQQARAMKEKYNAMQAKLAYEKEIGVLLVAAEAKAAVMDGDAIIRNRLESLPDILAPQLAAETDEQKIRALLYDQIEHLLGELSRTFNQMTHD